MKYLCVDIGTTCLKVQVFNEKGEILFYESKECQLKDISGIKHADIFAIKNAVFELIKLAVTSVGKVNSIAFSSFGESFVLLDDKDEILTYPMLYTDGRGEEEAKELEQAFGGEYFFDRCGVCPNAMYSIYKLLWIKKHLPTEFNKADKLMLICDYFGYLLTGERVIDYSLASRTGIFDIEKKEFCENTLEKLGINAKLFSKPKQLGTVVGEIKEDIRKEFGLNKGCLLILGSHDQVLATIGAGVLSEGESADGMGTVECVTTVFKNKPTDYEMGKCGYPVVPFINGLYCTYILNLTSNSIMSWYRNEILHKFKGEEESVYAYLEKDIESPTDVLVLPYFAGSSTPYNDVEAKGSIVNLTLNSKDGDIYRGIMESTSYEMKLNFEVVKKFGIEVKSVVATGGGANSKKWLQIKSDIFEREVKTLRSSEGGLCGLAEICSVALGDFKSLEEAREVFVKYKEEFLPKTTYKEIYENKFNKYKKLYKNLKEIF